MEAWARMEMSRERQIDILGEAAGVTKVGYRKKREKRSQGLCLASWPV